MMQTKISTIKQRLKDSFHKINTFRHYVSCRVEQKVKKNNLENSMTWAIIIVLVEKLTRRYCGMKNTIHHTVLNSSKNIAKRK